MKQNRRICFLCRAAAEFDETNFRNALWRLVENLGSIKKKQGECEGGVPALVKFFLSPSFGIMLFF